MSNHFESIHDLLWEGVFCPVYNTRCICYSFDNDALDDIYIKYEELHSTMETEPYKDYQLLYEMIDTHRGSSGIMMFRNIINNILMEDDEYRI